MTTVVKVDYVNKVTPKKKERQEGGREGNITERERESKEAISTPLQYITSNCLIH